MNFLEKITNIIFPPPCGFCNEINNNFLCINCYNKIKQLKLSAIDTYEFSNLYFKEHFYLFKYENTIRKQIINYKFNEKSYLYKTFSQILKQDSTFKNFISNYDCILSVPIHKKRLHLRGYNQSALIAKDISLYFNIPYYNDILFKTTHIVPQSTLNKDARKTNVHNAFTVKSSLKIANKTVILFEDIFTTGATTNECAKMLINNGATHIGIVTIAKY